MMKFFLAVLIPLISLASAQEFVSGKVRSTNGRAGRALTSITPADTCPKRNDVASFCENQGSCDQLQKIFVCNIGTAAEDPTECNVNDKKYCTGEPGQQRCSVTPDPSCPYERPDVCSKEGYYPDPNNCHAYYYCYKDPTTPAKIMSYKVDCPPGAPFNPIGPEDRLCQINGACVTANCTGALDDAWRPMSYKNFTTNRIAAKCMNGKATTSFVCPAGLSVDLTKPTATCKIICTLNYQKAVDESDPNGYLICILGKEYSRKCPVGQKFIPDKLECGV